MTTILEIQSVVAAKMGVSISDLKSDRRTLPLVSARHIAMYLCKTLTHNSLTVIGRRFGDRDHTTVIHAVGRIEAAINERQAAAETVAEFTKLLKPTGPACDTSESEFVETVVQLATPAFENAIRAVTNSILPQIQTANNDQRRNTLLTKEQQELFEQVARCIQAFTKYDSARMNGRCDHEHTLFMRQMSHLRAMTTPRCTQNQGENNG